MTEPAPLNLQRKTPPLFDGFFLLVDVLVGGEG
jgi:hypothetical protein